MASVENNPTRKTMKKRKKKFNIFSFVTHLQPIFSDQIGGKDNAENSGFFRVLTFFRTSTFSPHFNFGL
jgi:hypothetical protein